MNFQTGDLIKYKSHDMICEAIVRQVFKTELEVIVYNTFKNGINNAMKMKTRIDKTLCQKNN